MAELGEMKSVASGAARVEKSIIGVLSALLVYVVMCNPVEAGVIKKNVYMSETKGTVLLNGQPVVSAKVLRKVTRPKVFSEGEPYADETVTDSKGQFTLPEVSGNTWFFRPQLVSANPTAYQEIRLDYQDRNYLIWTYGRNFFEASFKESKVGNPVISCELAGAELFKRTGTYFVTCEVLGGIREF